MEKFMNWMGDVVAPKMEALTANAWLSAMQKAIIKTLPMVLVGSLIKLYSIPAGVDKPEGLHLWIDFSFYGIFDSVLCAGAEKEP